MAVGALAVPLGAVCVSLLESQAWAGTWRLGEGGRTALFWSVVLGVGGAATALVLALPVAWCLVRRGRGMAWVLGATLVPLLIPPHAYSYAWQIVAWPSQGGMPTARARAARRPRRAASWGRAPSRRASACSTPLRCC